MPLAEFSSGGGADDADAADADAGVLEFLALRGASFDLPAMALLLLLFGRARLAGGGVFCCAILPPFWLLLVLL